MPPTPTTDRHRLAAPPAARLVERPHRRHGCGHRFLGHAVTRHLEEPPLRRGAADSAAAMTVSLILPDLHDRLLLLFAGLLIDAAFGDMPAIFAHVTHPVVLAGRAIAFFDKKLNRPHRSEPSRQPSFPLSFSGG